jgi:hypothetical protein
MESLRNAAKKRAELAKFRAVQPKKDKKKDQGTVHCIDFSLNIKIASFCCSFSVIRLLHYRFDSDVGEGVSWTVR